jgi:hypothetical protein
MQTIIHRTAVNGAVFLLMLAAQTPAVAEVCDKAVGDSWRLEDGPVWFLNPTGFPTGLTILIGFLLVVTIAKRRWLAYLMSSVVIIAAAIAIFADLLPQHAIYLAQLREGCRSLPTDLLDVGILILFALLYVWMGHRGDLQPSLEQVDAT